VLFLVCFICDEVFFSFSFCNHRYEFGSFVDFFCTFYEIYYSLKAFEPFYLLIFDGIVGNYLLIFDGIVGNSFIIMCL
jgi:hypothetical protein